jgi:hypothetical protein
LNFMLIWLVPSYHFTTLLARDDFWTTTFWTANSTTVLWKLSSKGMNLQKKMASLSLLWRHHEVRAVARTLIGGAEGGGGIFISSRVLPNWNIISFQL